MTGVGIRSEFGLVEVWVVGVKAVEFKPDAAAEGLMSPGHDFLADAAGIGRSVA